VNLNLANKNCNTGCGILIDWDFGISCVCVIFFTRGWKQCEHNR